VVQNNVIAQIENEGFVAYAVWEPILRTDDERSSRKAATLFPDEHVISYWVQSRAVGEMFQAPIELTTEPAWDVYLVYEPGVEWGGLVPPAPTFFMHQLGGRLPNGQKLDGPKLREVIEAILEK
jgi:hypothetical protein